MSAKLIAIVVAMTATAAPTKAAKFTPSLLRRVDVTDGTPGQFDYYALAISWQPQFCYKQNFPGCKKPTDFMKNHFTLHGLWPNYNTGEYPSFCTNEAPSNQSIEQAGRADLNLYWTDVKSSTGTFWRNEWEKHGTCSGLDQVTYLQTSMKLLNQLNTPDVITNNVGKSISTSSVRKAFGSAVLICQGQSLQEVRTCWSKSKTIKRMNCPSSLLQQDTCRSDTITIQSF